MAKRRVKAAKPKGGGGAAAARKRAMTPAQAIRAATGTITVDRTTKGPTGGNQPGGGSAK